MVSPVAGDPGAPEYSNVTDAIASYMYTKSIVKNAAEPNDGGRKTPGFVIPICKFNRIFDDLISLNCFYYQTVKRASQ
jgi:hypothetical protein